MNKQSTPRGHAAASKSPSPLQAAAKKTNSVAAGARPLDGDMRRAMIAQGAYFRAEHRGFAAGGELDDWLQAEREIAASLGT